MAFEQTLTTSFKQDILLGVHDLETDEIRMALYLATANLGADTTIYTTHWRDIRHRLFCWRRSAHGRDGSDFRYYGVRGFCRPILGPCCLYGTGCANLQCKQEQQGDCGVGLRVGQDGHNHFTVQMPANTATSALIRIA